ncbi:MBL fold metallo-hydrolase [Candidatus Marinimicrobia bacterium]|nr:MBL fold metallo-hydrolase [Candidatus Neomarinimicrobiota bacterium]RZP30777.1 MAG: MBL fold metallo-hydrolase [bacterium]|tara:strand:+ start:6278 stop:6925 length:648 start_codon:yes stop_codon:yes gene_type:complete
MIETDFSIRTFRGGYDNNFSYLVSCMQTGIQFLIDAAISLDKIKPYINQPLGALLITHSHGDHTAYLNDILDEYPNAKFIGYKNLIHKSNKYEFYPVNDQDRVLLGKINIKIIHTPGHFPDSLCYLMENIIFTGDTLFVGRTGRTISANASTKDLYYSIYDKILSLPGNTLIYPGHDYGEKPTISLKENIKISPLLQAKSEKDFIERMANYEANR